MTFQAFRRGLGRALRVLVAAVAAPPTIARAETWTGTARSDYAVGEIGASRLEAADGADV